MTVSLPITVGAVWTVSVHSYPLPSSSAVNAEMMYKPLYISELSIVDGKMLFSVLKVLLPLLHTMSTLLVIPLTVIALHVSVSG